MGTKATKSMRCIISQGSVTCDVCLLNTQGLVKEDILGGDRPWQLGESSKTVENIEGQGHWTGGKVLSLRGNGEISYHYLGRKAFRKSANAPYFFQHISSRRHKDRVAGKPLKPKYSPYNKLQRSPSILAVSSLRTPVWWDSLAGLNGGLKESLRTGGH